MRLEPVPGLDCVYIMLVLVSATQHVLAQCVGAESVEGDVREHTKRNYEYTYDTPIQLTTSTLGKQCV
jgi:hypothetical protein